MFMVLVVAAALWPFQTPQAQHCRIELEAGAKSARCQVTLPSGRAVRRCAEADRQASHCTAAGRGARYVAWVVHHGPGGCRITDKKTKWGRGVVSAKVSKTGGKAASCDLYVELQ
jgi:hypothetical protein